MMYVNILIGIFFFYISCYINFVFLNLNSSSLQLLSINSFGLDFGLRKYFEFCNDWWLRIDAWSR